MSLLDTLVILSQQLQAAVMNSWPHCDSRGLRDEDILPAATGTAQSFFSVSQTSGAPSDDS